jgi:hypothetical protein
MTPNEFESHINGAIGAAIKSQINPAIVVTVLELNKRRVLSMIENVAAGAPPEKGRIITPPNLDGSGG